VHRRYEALRAYLAEGVPAAEAAARFGYTPASLLSVFISQSGRGQTGTISPGHCDVPAPNRTRS
jgi:hypothetical protein